MLLTYHIHLPEYIRSGWEDRLLPCHFYREKACRLHFPSHDWGGGMGLSWTSRTLSYPPYTYCLASECQKVNDIRWLSTSFTVLFRVCSHMRTYSCKLCLSYDTRHRSEDSYDMPWHSITSSRLLENSPPFVVKVSTDVPNGLFEPKPIKATRVSSSRPAGVPALPLVLSDRYSP